MLNEYTPIGREPISSKGGKLRISPAENPSRFNLRIDPQQLEAAGRVFGIALPDTIGGSTQGDGKTALCVGPDEWYLLAPPAEQETITRGFAELYSSVIHSLVDIGHREISILVEGDEAVSALQSVLAFNVSAMPVGTGCRTIMDKAQIILLREASDRFRIEVWHSFAPFVWQLLNAVSIELQSGV